MTTRTLMLASASMLALAAPARADEPTHLRTGIGADVNVGGGITAFTGSAMRGVMANSVTPLWEVGASIGTHVPIGVDVGYVGSATPLRALGTDDGNLIGTTFEAAIRYNILPHLVWNPYVFAGVGWQRYDVQSAKLAEADTGISREDNLAEFPMGAGITYRNGGGLIVDLRGTFRATTSSTLLLEDNGNHAALHSWEAGAAIGHEF